MLSAMVLLTFPNVPTMYVKIRLKESLKAMFKERDVAGGMRLVLRERFDEWKGEKVTWDPGDQT